MDIFAPLQALADRLAYGVLGLAPDSRTGATADFFIFDTAKIFLLLAVIIFVVSYLRSYLPPEKTRAFLARKSPLAGHLLAALVGVATPFCSCSAVPLFLGFVEAGVPLGITFTFLVASPMVNEVALALLLGMFGWKTALLYAGSGLLVAVLAGLAIGRLRVEGLLEDFVWKLKAGPAAEIRLSRRERAAYARGYAAEILGRVWPYVLAGVGLGAWIHGYVPTDFLARFAGPGNPFAVPLAVLAGIPLYSNAAGVLPLVGALTEKGLALGTTLAFMMAVTALSLPEFMILRKVMKPRLIAIFAGVVGVGIMGVGWMFNWARL